MISAILEVEEAALWNSHMIGTIKVSIAVMSVGLLQKKMSILLPNGPMFNQAA